jgi:hypothetical protein
VETLKKPKKIKTSIKISKGQKKFQKIEKIHKHLKKIKKIQKIIKIQDIQKKFNRPKKIHQIRRFNALHLITMSQDSRKEDKFW